MRPFPFLKNTYFSPGGWASRIAALVFLVAGGLAVLGAQESIVNFDQARSDSVFVDAGGGVRETSFTVTGNLQTLVFLVAFQAGNPELELVSPAGTRYELSSGRISLQRLVWGFMVGLSSPEIGTWKLRLLHTLGEASYQLKSIQVPAQPTLSVTAPALTGEPWSSQATVRGSTQPDQAGKTVRVLLATKRGELTGVQATETSVDASGNFQANLDPADFPAGEYFPVVALESGADLPSVKASAPGSLLRTQPAPLGAIEGAVFVTEVPGVLNLQFANPFGRRSATFRVHVKPQNASEEVIDIGSQTKARLTGFPVGKADVWLTAIDDSGRAGAPSSPVSVTFAPEAPVLGAWSLLAQAIRVPVVSAAEPLRFHLALSGSFSPSGAQFDWAQIKIGAPLPAGILLKGEKQSYYLPTDSANVAVSVWASAEVVPGEYTIPVVLQSVANPDHSVSAQVTLVVSAPSPAIEKLSISAWAQGIEVPLTITGENFFAGTRVFLDESELVITERSARQITATVPAAASAGVHLVKVTSNSGSSDSAAVTVRAPGYSVLAFKSFSKALPGSHARYWLAVSAQNGFSQSASFQIVNLPSGWSAQVEPAYVADGQTAVVDVTLPAGAIRGEYNFYAQTSEGGQVTLTAAVTAAPIDPFVSSLTSYSELAGGSFQIRGFGFGNVKASVEVDGRPWIVSSWNDDEISVQVPANAETGLLRVKLPDGRISNGITFGVKDYGFQFHTASSLFELQGGDTRSFDVQLAGYKQSVELQIQSSSPLIQASVSPALVTPVGIASVKLVLDKNIPVGSYLVEISGTSGLFQTSRTLNVHVGKALAFVTPSLPPAMEATSYSAQLAVEGASGSVTFALEDGVFPQGIGLSAGGTISGRSAQRGIFRLVIGARDTAAHYTAKEFLLNVEESGWTSARHDDGNSSFAALPSPADARTLWTSASLGSIPADATLLAGSGNLYVQTQDAIVALYAGSGKILYRIPGSYTNLRYLSGKLFALGTDNVLHAWEAGFGNEIYAREAVSAYWVNASNVYADGPLGIQTLETSSGTLVGTQAGDLSGQLAAYKGELYRILGKTLSKFTSDGWSAQWSHPSQDLVGIWADANALVVATATQGLSWTPSATTVLYQTPTRNLALAPEALIVDTGSALDVRDRVGGALVRSFPFTGSQAIVATSNRLFLVSSPGLKAINPARGNVVWETPSSRGAIVYGDRLYSVDSSGSVTAFHAPDNVAAPVTNVVTTPPAPDGISGWFVTSPQIALVATDNETVAASTVVQIDAAASAAYSAPFTLADGTHTLIYSSTDSGGLVEAQRTTTISIDSVRPVTTAQTSIAPLSGIPGVWGAPVAVALAATDATSGVLVTEYRTSASAAWQTYSAPIAYASEGVYRLEYRSRDNAGGWEAAKSLDLTLDFADPTVSANVVHGQGVETLVLTALDTGSGIQKIEYKFGTTGSVQTYAGPVVFSTTGHWDVFFRALDNAGRSSSWGSISIDNTQVPAGSAIDKIEYTAALKNRTVDPSVQIGNPLFLGSNSKFQNLPANLVGAAYLRGRDTDAQSSAANYIQITFKTSATVTMLAEPASKTNLAGWTKGATLPAGSINSGYFAQGLVTYTRTVAPGEKLTITGPGLNKTGGDLIFVQALWNGLSIAAPAQGAAYYPGARVEASALAGPDVKNLKWSLVGKLGERHEDRRDDRREGERRNELQVATGKTAAFTLPSSIDRGKIVLRVEGTLFGKPIADERELQILSPGKLKIRYPDGEDSIKVGTALTPIVVFKQEREKTKLTAGVTYTLTQNGKTIYRGAGPIPLSQVGRYTLSAAYTSSAGIELSAATDVKVTGEHAWRTGRWKDFLDRLRDDEDDGFEQRPIKLPLPAGCYELTVTVGKLKAWDVHTVTAGGQAINVSVKKDGQYVKLRFIAKAGAEGLVLKTTAGIPIENIQYRKIEDNTPTSAQIVATTDKAEE